MDVEASRQQINMAEPGGNSCGWIGCLLCIPATCDSYIASTAQEAQATATRQRFVKTETRAR